MGKKILILGGAGFIGSNLAKKFVEKDYTVSIIDGLMSETGGKLENIKDILSSINFYNLPIEEIKNLQDLIYENEIIVDAMAWTNHLGAIKNPIYDLELNCKSHLTLLLKIPRGKKVIYFGSRGQYGNPSVEQIDEKTVMVPEDIQGVHKLTAEYYFRIYSKLVGFDVLVIRFPNCFGENQTIFGKEIGLVGSFILNALQGKTIEVYGDNRSRSIIYVQDLVNAILILIEYKFKGFCDFNINGTEISILKLAKKIISIAGCGNVKLKSIPKHLAKLDIGNAKFIDKKFTDLFPQFKKTDLSISLKNTINYFKENLK